MTILENEKNLQKNIFTTLPLNWKKKLMKNMKFETKIIH